MTEKTQKEINSAINTSEEKLRNETQQFVARALQATKGALKKMAQTVAVQRQSAPVSAPVGQESLATPQPVS